MRELEILEKMDHPHIMSVKELMHDSDKYYVATELCEGGELFQHLVDYGTFSEKKAAKVVKQILSALNYMHTMKPNPIVHRDLKPENILVDSKSGKDPQVKIVDFGFA